jgi:hypothetical protein
VSGQLIVALVLAFLVVKFLSRRKSGPAHGHGGSGDRWGTSVHEASHVVVAKRMGGSASARLINGGKRGYFDASLPGSTTAVDDAVLLLAGGIGAKQITGDPHDRYSDDVPRARELLRGTGVSVDQARAMASRVVSSNKGAIRSTARRLDRNGRVS